MKQEKRAFLLLQDGTLLEGFAYGTIGTTGGELCFNTGMTGYQEVFTDPSYYGQVLIMNTAHVGNYGVKDTDIESSGIKIFGLICKNLSSGYSRSLADDALDSYLEKNAIVAIHSIDTRALVAHIRKNGAMNCVISSEIDDIEVLKQELSKIPSMNGLELASKVTCQEPYTLGDATSKKRVAVLDFGVKQHILECMVERGCYIKVFPSKSSFAECELFQPNAYFLSNGPGDPSVMPQAVETVKEILQSNKPLFGICLGHQLLALASGASTYKMHHGHRGLNHPVYHIKTGKSEISTQNHGFAVDKQSVEAISTLEITHINLNDDSLEGLRLIDKPAFSVQYHPEATPGPHDSRYLFDDFLAMIK